MSQSTALQRNAAPPLSLRRLPAVDTEPPFDDERAAGFDLPPGADRLDVGTVTGAGRQSVLAIAFALPGGLPGVPEVPPAVAVAALREPTTAPRGTPHLRLVDPAVVAVSRPRRPRRHRSSAATVEEEFGPQRTPRDELPEPALWAARLVQAFVEVRAGLRPASQLTRWTTTGVQDAVSRQPPAVAPDVSVGSPARRHGEVVRSVRVSEPVDGVVEVSAVVQRGDRCRAIALRLEGIDGRWQCTALQVG